MRFLVRLVSKKDKPERFISAGFVATDTAALIRYVRKAVKGADSVDIKIKSSPHGAGKKVNQNLSTPQPSADSIRERAREFFGTSLPDTALTIVIGFCESEVTRERDR